MSLGRAQFDNAVVELRPEKVDRHRVWLRLRADRCGFRRDSWFCEAGEIVSTVQIAMLGKLPYTVLHAAPLAHPMLA